MPFRRMETPPGEQAWIDFGVGAPVILPEGEALVGDVPATTAILDRFLHHADVITITGKSYRLRNKTAKDLARKSDGSADEACRNETT